MTLETSHEPIAIVGIGCNFPGAHGPAAFWELLSEGRAAIREVPPERFDIKLYHDPVLGRPGRIVTTRAGFIDDIDRFDPGFFGISPREADSMDPQQRLLLEAAWEAMEDAGIARARLRAATAGVFIGMSSADYGDLQAHQQDPSNLDVYTLSGTARSILAGRISHALDLRGPSFAVDTACSSSLVAVYLACQSLWDGGCDLALAGGVNLILTPEPWMVLSLARIISPDGEARVFDAHANGFVRGEGAGIVVLKPLAQAQTDGDPIYAVIRGAAINNDGRNSSVMTPNGQAQEAVLRAAYRHAGIAPGAVHYVEAHGTGTSVGDPIEARALGAVMAEGRAADMPCRIGSVKTNIGHLEAAAGISGLIKTALCLKHRAIPPSLHFATPNPAVPWDDLPLVVQREFSAWPVADGPALAGVSSFGISGTNVHLVLADAPPAPSLQAPAANDVYLLPVSAHTADALAAAVARIHDFLAGEGAALPLRDICYTAGVRRTHHAHRAAFAGRTHQEMIDQLAAWRSGEAAVNVETPQTGGPVFVFSGQGAQFWPLDAALLAQLPVFRSTLQTCDDLLRAVGADWSLLPQLIAADGASRLHETAVCQAAIFTCQVALAAQWRAWGIAPAAVIGHSLGEVAAAHVAGALTLEQALHLVMQRGRITAQAAGQGAMALVALPADAAAEAIHAYAPALAIAAVNSPTTCVLSGAPVALDAVLAQLTARGVFARRLPAIDYAAHSPQMEPLSHELAATLHGLVPQPITIPFYSTVTATPLDGTALDAGYWADNLRRPVRFGDALQTALADGHRLLLEVHPTQVLNRPIQEGITQAGVAGAVYSSLQRDADGPAVLLRALGALYTHGCVVAWTHVFPAGGRHVTLPATPWQKRRHWLPGMNQPGGRVHGRPLAGEGRRPLLGLVLRSAADPSVSIVQSELAANHPRYLADHRIDGAVVLPAAAYIELALELARELDLPAPYTLTDLALDRALVLPEAGVVDLQVAATISAAALALEYYSRPTGVDDAAWTPHARATVTLGVDATTMPPQIDLDAFQADADAVIAQAAHYRAMAAHGLEYGPAFQGIDQLWRCGREALARLVLPEAVAADLARHELHPAVLDLALQTVAVLLDDSVAAETLLPVALQSLHIHADPQQVAYAHAILHPAQAAVRGRRFADVTLLDQDGRVLVTAQGLALQPLAGAANAAHAIDRYLYQVVWQPLPLPDDGAHTASAPARWLITGEAGELAQLVAAQMAAQGIDCTLATETDAAPVNLASRAAVDRWLAAQVATGQTPDAILYLAGPDAAADSESTFAPPAGEAALIGLLHLVQSLSAQSLSNAPRLWVVTRGAQCIAETDRITLPQTALWGLARTVALEAPQLHCTLLDLPAAPDPEDVRQLCREVLAGGAENQLAYRHGQRLAARLARYTPDPTQPPRLAAPGEAFRLESTTPGILDHLVLAATERPPLAADQVEIRVHSAGLNFLDVLTALGLRPDQEGSELVLGMECAGAVTQVGAAVTGVAVGDEVLAVAPHSMAAYTRTLADFVMPKPASLSFEEAAAAPIAYLTAYYALHTLGRIRAGERILIHAAAGGVGLAAVHLAQRAGAEIYATAGSAEKRAYLRQLGVAHVMDSRTLDFADEVMARTHGEGVDLVLNALAGDAIPRSLATLRANGRFLEIGKRDIYGHSKLDMGLLKKNVAFFAIDLIPLLRAQPTFCKELLADVTGLLARGAVPPLPTVAFPITQASEAFRHMAQAKHTGKIVLTVAAGAPVDIAPRPRDAIRRHGTYLITGGLGGLGLKVAAWLVAQGARTLVLLGRRPPTPAADHAIAALTAQGAQVLTVQADVAQEVEVRSVLDRIAGTLPPLCGVFHAAGVLDDGLLLNLDVVRMRGVMAAKVDGAWLLHRLTQHMDIDLFVIFSSATAVLGAPGQANYAAANAFLDGLAHDRRAQGLPALAIDWGAWAEVGMAARLDAPAQLTAQGILPFAPELGVQMLARCLAGSAAQVTAIHADWPRVGERFATPLLRDLTTATATATAPKASVLAAQLCALAPDERQAAVTALLQKQLAQVLRTPAHTLNPRQPLSELGIDSLMTVELVNRIELELGITIPLSALLQGPTLHDLTALLVKLLNESGAAPADAPANAEANLLDKGFARNVTTLAEDARLDPGIRFGAVAVSARTAPTDILLTGATGFVGAFLLHDLLNTTEARVHCLVRAADATAGRARLLDTLARDFPGETRDPVRIVAVPGDLAQPDLGLSAAVFDDLAARVDLVMHSGAQINWLAPYAQLKPANVLGTETLIRLAARRGVPLHYLSSLAVFPVIGSTASVIDEQTPLAHGGVLHGGYTQSKWVAEMLVAAAHRRGLPGAIYRPSLIVGHSQTGIWQGDNIVATMLRAWVELGSAPDIDGAFDLVPVDYVSRAIVRAITCGGDGVYHLHNPQPVSARTLVDWMVASGYSLQKLPYPTWRAAMLGRGDVPRRTVLAAVGPLLALELSADAAWLAQTPRYDGVNTQQMLAGSACPPVDTGMFGRYVASLCRTGYLPAPG